MDTSSKEVKPAKAAEPSVGGGTESEEWKELERRANLIADPKERDKWYADQIELVRLRRQNAQQEKQMKELERKKAEEMKRVQEAAQRQMETNMNMMNHFLTTYANAGFKDVSALGESVKKNNGMIDLNGPEGQLIMAGIETVVRGKHQQQPVRQPAPETYELENRHRLLRELHYGSGDSKMQDDYPQQREQPTVEASRSGGGRGQLSMAEQLLDEVQGKGLVSWSAEATYPKGLYQALPYAGDKSEPATKKRRFEAPSGLGLNPA